MAEYGDKARIAVLEAGALPVTYAPLVVPRGNVVKMLGDSIANHGQAAVNGGLIQSNSILAHASAGSDGRVWYGDIDTASGTIGVSGAQTSDTRASHLPFVLAEKPHVCIVETCINDVLNGVSPAVTKANLIYIWEQLAQARILPVAWTPTPYNPPGATDARRAAIMSLRAWMIDYCAEHRIPCFDAYAAALDPASPGDATYAGNWRTADVDVDGLHPLAAGAKRLGVALALFLDGVLPARWPLFARTASEAVDAASLVLNPGMAGSGSVPDNWTLITGTGTSAIASAAADGIAGNWWTIVKTGSAGPLRYKSDAFTVVPGNRVALSAKLKLTLEGTTLPDGRLRLMDTALATNICGFVAWTQDTPGVWHLYMEAVIPASVTSARLHFEQASTTNVNSVQQLAQAAVYDLTVLGAQSRGAAPATARLAKAASYTMVASDRFVAVTSTAAARTITLPAASATNPGEVYLIKDESGAAGTNNITVQRAGSDTVEGGTSVAISANYGFKRLYSDGVSKWFVV